MWWWSFLLPQATDRDFVDKLNSKFKAAPNFEVVRNHSPLFTIVHYAGKVSVQKHCHPRYLTIHLISDFILINSVIVVLVNNWMICIFPRWDSLIRVFFFIMRALFWHEVSFCGLFRCNTMQVDFLRKTETRYRPTFVSSSSTASLLSSAFCSQVWIHSQLHTSLDKCKCSNYSNKIKHLLLSLNTHNV